MATTPVLDVMPLQSPPGLSGPSCAPSILPPPPPDCSSSARSSSPRRRLLVPPPLSSSTSRRRASRPENSVAAAPSSPLSPSPSPSTPVRRRRQNTACSHAATTTITTTAALTTVDSPVLWGEDTIADHASSADNITSQLGLVGQDDDFLSAFADHEFSSPSSYPPFTVTANLSAGGASPSDQAAFPLRQATATAAPPRHTPVCHRVSAAPLGLTTQLSSSTVEESQLTVSSNDNWDEPLSQLSNGSFSGMLPPPPPQLHHLQGEISTSPQNKRRPPLASEATLSHVMMEPSQGLLDSDDDLFGDGIMPRDMDPIHDQNLTTIDLTEATDVPEELKKPLGVPPKEENKIKLSKFQCVICMDDASTLTVTHCGHLYCAQCLHSSLHVEATKNKCPMCRAKIDVKSRAAYSTKTKGFWPLELKLMTATKKGKRKADDIS
ncbi:hypothetical protein E4U54_003324 [Claviceps lovelessii]|nr:hypothetical protein E4U54_003324 [Claviceps lovelessii]